jgi:hypothetical protein
MDRMLAILAISVLAALPARAEGFAPIRDRGEFLSLVEGRELRLNLFRIRIEVRGDGQIVGSALGWDLSGDWDWRDGYFCREMDWSGYEIPLNCQLVEAKGAEAMRFTVDKGAGDSALFKLR